MSYVPAPSTCMKRCDVGSLFSPQVWHGSLGPLTLIRMCEPSVEIEGNLMNSPQVPLIGALGSILMSSPASSREIFSTVPVAISSRYAEPGNLVRPSGVKARWIDENA